MWDVNALSAVELHISLTALEEAHAAAAAEELQRTFEDGSALCGALRADPVDAQIDASVTVDVVPHVPPLTRRLNLLGNALRMLSNAYARWKSNLDKAHGMDVFVAARVGTQSHDKQRTTTFVTRRSESAQVYCNPDFVHAWVVMVMSASRSARELLTDDRITF